MPSRPGRIRHLAAAVFAPRSSSPALSAEATTAGTTSPLRLRNDGDHSDHGDLDREADRPRVGERGLDLLFYAMSLTFAVGCAVASGFYGYRIWGNAAAAAYLVAVAHTAICLCRPLPGRWGSRWTPVVISAVGAIAVPLGYLVARRSPSFVWGPWPWSFPAQPEGWVVERAARLWRDTGSPYLNLDLMDRQPIPDDYTPYGPTMSVFGLPRALFGDSAFTDARIWFLVGAVASISAAWWVARRDRAGTPGTPGTPPAATTVGVAQLLTVSPLTALTLVVAGDDIVVIGLIALLVALGYRANPLLAGVVAALAVTVKLTALPAVIVVAVGIVATRGIRAFSGFATALVAGTAVIVLPVLMSNPSMFVEHVIRFPAGLGRAESPAASPLPGHLIAMTGPVGHAAALVVLGTAAVAVAGWVLRRPPRTAADATLRIAVGLGAAIALAPATRFGYLVYPVALLGVLLGFRAVDRAAPSVTSSSSSSHRHGPAT